MAIEMNLLKRNLVINVEDGVTDEGKPKLKARTYTGIKGDATVDALFAVGTAIGSLMQAQVSSITLSDKSALNEVA